MDKEILQEKIDAALKEAVEAIYFDDNNDYGTYLWKIVEILGGEEATELLEANEQQAYDKYVEVRNK